MRDWYVIVDGAADPRLYPVVSSASRHACLYQKDYDEETLAALPHLVKLVDGEQLPDLWRQYEAGRFWGIALQSSLELSALRRHLRKFTTARLPDGEVVLYRFWDPRIFRTFCESAEPSQLEEFFGKVETVIADLGADGRRRYNWAGGLQVASAPSQTESQPAGH